MHRHQIGVAQVSSTALCASATNRRRWDPPGGTDQLRVDVTQAAAQIT